MCLISIFIGFEYLLDNNRESLNTPETASREILSLPKIQFQGLEPQYILLPLQCCKKTFRMYWIYFTKTKNVFETAKKINERNIGTEDLVLGARQDNLRKSRRKWHSFNLSKTDQFVICGKENISKIFGLNVEPSLFAILFFNLSHFEHISVGIKQNLDKIIYKTKNCSTFNFSSK